MSHLDISPFYGLKTSQLPGWKRLILKIWPLHTFYQLRSELLMLVARCRQIGLPRRYRDSRDLKVNIGCGSRGLPDWVNVDFLALPSVNCICDCRKALPFPDNSVAAIFSEHFFEHIDYTEEVPYFLAECHRVLQPGGVVRIIVPDAGRYLQAYHQPGWPAMNELRHLQDNHFDPYTGSRYRTKMELVNEVFRQAYTHKFAYDAETLIQVLRDAQFRTVEQQQFGSSFHPELAIDLESRAHESLYVEAVK